MTKTILLTGATDGIGLATARHLVGQGHRVLVHGRNPAKLAAVAEELGVETHQADLSKMDEVEALAAAIRAKHTHLDALVNNAGVFHTGQSVTAEGLDVRFVVNTLAPYLLTLRLLSLLGPDSRIVNLSSAAQAPVDPAAFVGERALSANAAYAQSKLAITMWSKHLADALGAEGPAVIAVNPGSLLATKMVREGYGIAGSDVNIGVQAIVRCVVDPTSADRSGQYLDQDRRQFGRPHPDALDARKNAALTGLVEKVLKDRLHVSI